MVCEIRVCNKWRYPNCEVAVSFYQRKDTHSLSILTLVTNTKAKITCTITNAKERQQFSRPSIPQLKTNPAITSTTLSTIEIIGHYIAMQAHS